MADAATGQQPRDLVEFSFTDIAPDARKKDVNDTYLHAAVLAARNVKLERNGACVREVDRELNSGSAFQNVRQREVDAFDRLSRRRQAFSVDDAEYEFIANPRLLLLRTNPMVAGREMEPTREASAPPSGADPLVGGPKRGKLEKKICLNFVIDALATRLAERALMKDMVLYVLFVIFYIAVSLSDFNPAESYFVQSQIVGQLRDRPLPSLEGFIRSRQAKGGWVDDQVDPFFSVGRSPNSTVAPVPNTDYHTPRTFLQMRSIRDWHVWFQSVVIDYLWDNDYRDSSRATAGNNYVQGLNLKVGALDVRVVSMRNDSCTLNENLVTGNSWGGVLPTITDPATIRLMVAASDQFMPPVQGQCYAVVPSAIANPQPSDRVGLASPSSDSIMMGLNQTSFYGPPANGALLQYVDCRRAAFRPIFAAVADWPCAGHRIMIPFSGSKDETMRLAESLRPSAANGFFGIIDPLATRAVLVAFVTYTPAIDTFFLFKAVTEISPSGAMQNSVQATPFNVFSAGTPPLLAKTFFFFVFYIFVGAYVYKVIQEAVNKCIEGGFASWVLNIWNFLDLINLSCFFVVLIFRVTWIALSTRKSGSTSTLLTSLDYDDDLDFIAFLVALHQSLNAVNIVLSLLKVMKFLALNPTMSILSRTLARAFTDILGVLLLLLLFLTGFAIAGVILFGRVVKGFRSLPHAIQTMLRFLMSDFDYPEMREVRRSAAPFYFWSYVILGLFVFIGMIIGIITEAFTAESELTKQDGLSESLAGMLNALRQMFWRDGRFSPLSWLTEAREASKSEFLRNHESKAHVVLHELRVYRIYKLDERQQAIEAERGMMSNEPSATGGGRNADDECFSSAKRENDLAYQSDVVLASLLENDRVKINRHDLRSVFTQADPKQDRAQQRLSFVGDSVLDDVWDIAYDAYVIQRREERDQRSDRRRSQFERTVTLALVDFFQGHISSATQKRPHTTTAASGPKTGSAPEQKDLSVEGDEIARMKAVRGMLCPDASAWACIAAMNARTKEACKALRRVALPAASALAKDVFGVVHSTPGGAAPSEDRFTYSGAFQGFGAGGDGPSLDTFGERPSAFDASAFGAAPPVDEPPAVKRTAMRVQRKQTATGAPRPTFADEPTVASASREPAAREGGAARTRGPSLFAEQFSSLRRESKNEWSGDEGDNDPFSTSHGSDPRSGGGKAPAAAGGSGDDGQTTVASSGGARGTTAAGDANRTQPAGGSSFVLPTSTSAGGTAAPSRSSTVPAGSSAVSAAPPGRSGVASARGELRKVQLITEHDDDDVV